VKKILYFFLAIIILLLVCSKNVSPQANLLPTNTSFGIGELKIILRLEVTNSGTKTSLENALIFLSKDGKTFGELTTDILGVSIIVWKVSSPDQFPFPDTLGIKVVKAGYNSKTMSITKESLPLNKGNNRFIFPGKEINWPNKIGVWEILRRIQVKSYVLWNNPSQEYTGPSIYEYKFQLKEGGLEDEK